jgi:hypothetical protein
LHFRDDSIVLYQSELSVEKPLKDELTVVTAYFNIGSFGKGSTTNVFTPNLYKEWLRVFTLIRSPVIGYFDTDEYADLFAELRRRLPSNMTVVHKVNRSEVSCRSLRGFDAAAAAQS